eukprot:Pgem_evm1s8191
MYIGALYKRTFIEDICIIKRQGNPIVRTSVTQLKGLAKLVQKTWLNPDVKEVEGHFTGPNNSLLGQPHSYNEYISRGHDIDYFALEMLGKTPFTKYSDADIKAVKNWKFNDLSGFLGHFWFGFIKKYAVRMGIMESIKLTKQELDLYDILREKVEYYISRGLEPDLNKSAIWTETLKSYGLPTPCNNFSFHYETNFSSDFSLPPMRYTDNTKKYISITKSLGL